MMIAGTIFDSLMISGGSKNKIGGKLVNTLFMAL